MPVQNARWVRMLLLCLLAAVSGAHADTATRLARPQPSDFRLTLTLSKGEVLPGEPVCIDVRLSYVGPAFRGYVHRSGCLYYQSPNGDTRGGQGFALGLPQVEDFPPLRPSGYRGSERELTIGGFQTIALWDGPGRKPLLSEPGGGSFWATMAVTVSTGDGETWGKTEHLRIISSRVPVKVSPLPQAEREPHRLWATGDIAALFLDEPPPEANEQAAGDLGKLVGGYPGSAYAPYACLALAKERTAARHALEDRNSGLVPAEKVPTFTELVDEEFQVLRDAAERYPLSPVAGELLRRMGALARTQDKRDSLRSVRALVAGKRREAGLASGPAFRCSP